MSEYKAMREEAANAIANYMHHELFEITGNTNMPPWLREQGDSFMEMIDRAVAAAKAHPMADEVRKMNNLTTKPR